MKTYMANPAKIERKWYVVDAEGCTLGRLASEVAKVLRGKNKPEYTPHVDTGDYVIVINAEKIVVTGKKLDQKIYYNHSGYTGGLRQRTAKEMKANYNELKNYILSYGVKSRISNNYDSFNKGRLSLFKLATSGKSLKLYLNLD